MNMNKFCRRNQFYLLRISIFCAPHKRQLEMELNDISISKRDEKKHGIGVKVSSHRGANKISNMTILEQLRFQHAMQSAIRDVIVQNDGAFDCLQQLLFKQSQRS